MSTSPGITFYLDYLKNNYVQNKIYGQKPVRAHQDRVDHVDVILREWHASRPDMDFSALEVVARVLRAAHHLQTRLDRVAATYGLSHRGDLDVLTDLYRTQPPYQLTPSELAGSLLLTAGGMTLRLNRLQSAGLVERHPNPRDGRGVLVRLTATGVALAEDALATLLDTQASSIAGLEPVARRELADLLRALLISYDDAPTPRPPAAVERPRR